MMAEVDVVRALERSTYFKGVPSTALHGIGVHVTVQRFAAGAVVVARGSAPDAMFVLLDGAVEVHRMGFDHKVSSVAVLLPGMFVAHVAMMSRAPRSALVQARVDSTALRFDSAAVDRLMADDGVVGSAFRRALVMALSNQLSAANRRLTAVLQGPDEPTLDEQRVAVQDLSKVLVGQFDDG